ncbi:MAG: hypothetical protein R6V77_01815 [Candidatus Cloacimonadaceae bacterium]
MKGRNNWLDDISMMIPDCFLILVDSISEENYAKRNDGTSITNVIYLQVRWAGQKKSRGEAI